MWKRSRLAMYLGTDVPAPLASTILSQAMDLPISAPQAELPTSSSSKGAPSAQPKTSQSTEKKIPKWLKLGQSEFTNLLGRKVCYTD